MPQADSLCSRERERPQAGAHGCRPAQRDCDGETCMIVDLPPQHLICDPALIAQPDPTMFEPGAAGSAGITDVRQAGRRAVYFRRIGSGEYVLRHYWRGGQAARLSRQSYLWLGRDRSRPFREWRLLHSLWRQGLPVPRPAAARVVRRGPVYRGDILVERLPGARTLAELAARQALPRHLWERIGHTVRRFHDAGAFHADLNASNIMLDDRGCVFLIDWDRGRLRRPAAGWQRANLARLARSLTRFVQRHPAFHWTDDDWAALMRGYDGRAPSPPGVAGSTTQLPLP